MVYKEPRISSITRAKRTRRGMMKSELVKKYDGDLEFVTLLMDRCTSEGFAQPNPNAPNREDKTLFFVYDDIALEDIAEWRCSKSVKLQTEASKDTAESLMSPNGLFGENNKVL